MFNQIPHTMKKIFTTLLAVVALTGFLRAQTSGGPDAFGYTWRTDQDPNGPTFNWIDIDSFPETVDVTALADDNIRGPFSLQIPFHFYWYDPAVFYVGSNGYIGFSNGTLAHAFPSIPDSVNATNNFLAALATDLTFTNTSGQAIAGTTCKYRVSPGLDSLVVTYTNVPFWDPAAPGYQGTNTFQIILCTADSSITYQYLLQSSASQNPAPGQITTGIENVSGNMGLQYLFDVYPSTGSAVKFYYPQNVSIAINDAGISAVGNANTGAIFLSKNGAPYSSTVEVTNFGNQPLSPFNVASRILSATNVPQLRDTVIAPALAPSQVQQLNFPLTWTPTVAGTFRHFGKTLLTGDATSTNNEKPLEIQVVDTTLLNIKLSYNNTVNLSGGISWNGGGGGIGCYFAPPFYPCYLNQVSLMIAADPNFFGCHLQVYADDGVNGGPGTMLDSVFLDPNNIIAGTVQVVDLNQASQITSGGFYVAWIMGGDGIALDEDLSAPFSNRSFEILGAASNPNAWSTYRNSATNEPIINAIISTSPLGIDAPVELNNEFGNCSPNPAKDYTRIAYSLNQSMKNVVCTVTDLQGKLVMKKTFDTVNAGKGSLFIPTNTLKTGVYIVEIANSEQSHRSKLSVVK